ncbi:MAG TPA: hypothetical protein VMY69_05235 [Phycisphaerae bacterium]|nr:hypothetical protein [Phycisphaerae bacterium]
MHVDLIDEILKPPLRERERVEKALAQCGPRAVLLLSGLLSAGLVRGDWRRVLVRKRIRELTGQEC